MSGSHIFGTHTFVVVPIFDGHTLASKATASNVYLEHSSTSAGIAQGKATVKHFLFAKRDAKIKSSPIICNVRIIEEDMTSRENKVSWINIERWFRENKVTRIISVLQYGNL